MTRSSAIIPHARQHRVFLSVILPAILIVLSCVLFSGLAYAQSGGSVGQVINGFGESSKPINEGVHAVPAQISLIEGIALLLFLILAVAFLVFAFMTTRWRVNEQKKRESEALHSFEKTVVETLKPRQNAPEAERKPIAEEDKPLVENLIDSHTDLKPVHLVSTSAVGRSRPSTPNRTPSQQGMEGVLERLVAGNLVKEQSGTLTLDPNLSPAVKILLKNGKRAVVFPVGTPIALVLSNARLTDYLILSQPDGSALVCRTLSDFIADMVFTQK
jgi:hypothetical protein